MDRARRGREDERVPLARRLLPALDPREARFVAEILRKESVGGLLALGGAFLAVVWANSPWDASYHSFTGFDLGPLDLAHWGADGALTIFFFVAGLEVKREFLVGSLRRPADAAVPVTAAVCGVVVPALMYVAVNTVAPTGHPGGWVIPAATDIAFALAVLAVVGSHLPPTLRAFLLTLAVVDDLVVIVIIAVVSPTRCTSSTSGWPCCSPRRGPSSSGSACRPPSCPCRWPWRVGGSCTRVACTPPSPASCSAC
jgi:NhaA family Na+:H+ antiporter